ncbi:MFS transporter [bacterium]|nr:MAG: MFS transporter [bacterium]
MWTIGRTPLPSERPEEVIVPSPSISAATRWALAIGCAVAVSNLYFLQPLLGQVARGFGVSESRAGLATTLTQVGYALGMLTIVPLGDIRERRSLVLTMLGLTSVVALAMAAVPSFSLLLVLSLLLGFASCSPQLLVPFAAELSSKETRGRVLGFVVSGLLLGILLARTVSGFIGAHLGWRAVYVMAAVLGVILAVFLRILLPKSRPGERVPYPELMRSLLVLVREEPVLRESAAYGALLFAAFSAFWTTLSFLLEPRGLGPDIVGLFGLVGAAGALAAPLAGRLADTSGPRRTILVGILVTTLSFAVMLQSSIPALLIGVLLMDVGVQAAHVSNQSRYYSRRPESRSRMNTVYMTCYFIGGSLGSALGAWAWGAFGWPGVCAVGVGAGLLALAVFVTRKPETVP